MGKQKDPIECDCCRSEDPPGGVEDYGLRKLCNLCVSTMTSAASTDDRRASLAEVLKAICYVGNEIIRRLDEKK
jgi:hypothetical protein